MSVKKFDCSLFYQGSDCFEDEEIADLSLHGLRIRVSGGLTLRVVGERHASDSRFRFLVAIGKKVYWREYSNASQMVEGERARRIDEAAIADRKWDGRPLFVVFGDERDPRPFERLIENNLAAGRFLFERLTSFKSLVSKILEDKREMRVDLNHLKVLVPLGGSREGQSFPLPDAFLDVVRQGALQEGDNNVWANQRVPVLRAERVNVTDDAFEFLFAARFGFEEEFLFDDARIDKDATHHLRRPLASIIGISPMIIGDTIMNTRHFNVQVHRFNLGVEPVLFFDRG